ncbi:hypothetical protein [Propioniciclava flava]
MVMPDADKVRQTVANCSTNSPTCWGGRAAEESRLHEDDRAADDIEKASRSPARSVTDYGMSEAIGAVVPARPTVSLGRDMGGGGRDYSEDVAGTIDREWSDFIATAHQEAFDVLVENREVLDELVRQLFEPKPWIKAGGTRLRAAQASPAASRLDQGPTAGRPSDVPPIEVPSGRFPNRLRWLRSPFPWRPGPARPQGGQPYPGQVPGSHRASPAGRIGRATLPGAGACPGARGPRPNYPQGRRPSPGPAASWRAPYHRVACRGAHRARLRTRPRPRPARRGVRPGAGEPPASPGAAGRTPSNEKR